MWGGQNKQIKIKCYACHFYVHDTVSTGHSQKNPTLIQLQNSQASGPTWPNNLKQEQALKLIDSWLYSESLSELWSLGIWVLFLTNLILAIEMIFFFFFISKEGGEETWEVKTEGCKFLRKVNFLSKTLVLSLECWKSADRLSWFRFFNQARLIFWEFWADWSVNSYAQITPCGF